MIIKIDTSIWVTAAQLAKELGYTKKDKTQRITNWVARNKVVSKKIPELGLTLIDRRTVMQLNDC